MNEAGLINKSEITEIMLGHSNLKSAKEIAALMGVSGTKNIATLAYAFEVMQSIARREAAQQIIATAEKIRYEAYKQLGNR